MRKIAQIFTENFGLLFSLDLFTIYMFDYKFTIIDAGTCILFGASRVYTI